MSKARRAFDRWGWLTAVGLAGLIACGQSALPESAPPRAEKKAAWGPP